MTLWKLRVNDIQQQIEAKITEIEERSRVISENYYILNVASTADGNVGSLLSLLKWLASDEMDSSIDIKRLLRHTETVPEKSSRRISLFKRKDALPSPPPKDSGKSSKDKIQKIAEHLYKNPLETLQKYGNERTFGIIVKTFLYGFRYGIGTWSTLFRNVLDTVTDMNSFTMSILQRKSLLSCYLETFIQNTKLRLELEMILKKFDDILAHDENMQSAYHLLFSSLLRALRTDEYSHEWNGLKILFGLLAEYGLDSRVLVEIFIDIILKSLVSSGFNSSESLKRYLDKLILKLHEKGEESEIVSIFAEELCSIDGKAQETKEEFGLYTVTLERRFLCEAAFACGFGHVRVDEPLLNINVNRLLPPSVQDCLPKDFDELHALKLYTNYAPSDEGLVIRIRSAIVAEKLNTTPKLMENMESNLENFYTTSLVPFYDHLLGLNEKTALEYSILMARKKSLLLDYTKSIMGDFMKEQRPNLLQDFSLVLQEHSDGCPKGGGYRKKLASFGKNSFFSPSSTFKAADISISQEFDVCSCYAEFVRQRNINVLKPKLKEYISKTYTEGELIDGSLMDSVFPQDLLHDSLILSLFPVFFKRINSKLVKGASLEESTPPIFENDLFIKIAVIVKGEMKSFLSCPPSINIGTYATFWKDACKGLLELVELFSHDHIGNDEIFPILVKLLHDLRLDSLYSIVYTWKALLFKQCEEDNSFSGEDEYWFIQLQAAAAYLKLSSSNGT
ncbi:hypothetical protein MP638_007080 [Amoeboaphelidium occidentale]|nr:hypothetical protein MP638_007080 [Amoeboaphelidium occidentale]